MNLLRLVSLQAPNADFFYAGLARYLSERVELQVETVDSVCWRERNRMLDAGEAHIAFLCGTYYTNKVAAVPASIELLAAPVMAARRYAGRSVYCSDVVVRRDSPIRTFEDLRGAAWGFNEPGSHSGFNVVRYHLASRRLPRRFFGTVTETGAHQSSLEQILAGRLDASAIDSTVLELERTRRPELAARLRVIDVLGPSPIPPGVVSRRVPVKLRERLRRALLGMHRDESGRALLESAAMLKFARANDSDYDGIRRMSRVARDYRFAS